jgi:hypothetical protein
MPAIHPQTYPALSAFPSATVRDLTLPSELAAFLSATVRDLTLPSDLAAFLSATVRDLTLPTDPRKGWRSGHCNEASPSPYDSLWKKKRPVQCGTHLHRCVFSCLFLAPGASLQLLSNTANFPYLQAYPLPLRGSAHNFSSPYH